MKLLAVVVEKDGAGQRDGHVAGVEIRDVGVRRGGAFGRGGAVGGFGVRLRVCGVGAVGLAVGHGRFSVLGGLFGGLLVQHDDDVRPVGGKLRRLDEFADLDVIVLAVVDRLRGRLGRGGRLGRAGRLLGGRGRRRRAGAYQLKREGGEAVRPEGHGMIRDAVCTQQLPHAVGAVVDGQAVVVREARVRHGQDERRLRLTLGGPVDVEQDEVGVLVGDVGPLGAGGDGDAARDVPAGRVLGRDGRGDAAGGCGGGGASGGAAAHEGSVAQEAENGDHEQENNDEKPELPSGFAGCVHNITTLFNRIYAIINDDGR